ncbi:MAG: cysteine desulfurase family protein [Phycisphaerales bacterium JB039]
MRIYLDSNATTQPTPAVIAAVRSALETNWANPSSLHRAGQGARRIVELARRQVAELLGARTGEIIFTSGGTESIYMALRGVLDAAPGRALVTSRIEHPAVIDLAQRLQREGKEVRWIEVTGAGVIDLDCARGLIDDGVALVSVQWANNETGALQPVEQLREMCRAAGCLLHTDATQAAGKEPVGAARADLLTLSAHKFHGPKGVGALYVRRGLNLAWPCPGSQELGRRAGTENVPAIAGLGAAAAEARAWLADDEARAQARALRDEIEQRLCAIAGARVLGPPGAQRLWNTLCISFAGAAAEPLLMALSERGVCISGGAACASGAVEMSPVLRAMGVADEVGASAIRISLSRLTGREEALAGAAAIAETVQNLRSA